ncbi:MAG: SPOR domain-containing protein [Bacteroidales bacterium]|nr:SPOR domain-containing protein [Bacteroidales bacterium]
MNLESLIRTFLMGAGKVSIPALGTLSVQYHPARLAKSEQIDFVPPRYEIVYSKEYVEMPIFIQYVSTKLNVTDEQAVALLEDYGADFEQSFSAGEDFEIKTVGVIHANGEFESKITSDSFPDTYGLAGFSMDKLSDAEKKNAKQLPKKIVKNTAKAMIIASPILFGALLIPNILHVAQNDELASAFRNTNASVDFSQPELPRPHEFKSNAVVVEEQQENVETVVEPIATTPKKDSKIEEEITELKNTIAPIKEVSEYTADAKYFIIVGTFSVKANAEKFSKKLQAKDYKSGVISDNNKNRVYLNAFASADEAQQYVKDLQSNSEYGKAWVYVKNS